MPATWQAILLALPFNGCLWNYNLRKKNIVILKLTCFYLDSHLLNPSDIHTNIYFGESLSDSCIQSKWWTKIFKLNNNNKILIKLTIGSRPSRKWHFVGKSLIQVLCNFLKDISRAFAAKKGAKENILKFRH